jgi:drug/metabolite transporter (DMT)-like permease
VSLTLWASAFVGIRVAGTEFAPGPLAAGRLLIAAVVLGLIVLARREPLPTRRELPLIVLCGVLWFALYNVALNAGERQVDAGTASMIVRVAPILIALPR